MLAVEQLFLLRTSNTMTNASLAEKTSQYSLVKSYFISGGWTVGGSRKPLYLKHKLACWQSQLYMNMGSWWFSPTFISETQTCSMAVTTIGLWKLYWGKLHIIYSNWTSWIHYTPPQMVHVNLWIFCETAVFLLRNEEKSLQNSSVNN